MKAWEFKPSPEALAEGIDKLAVFPRQEDFLNHLCHFLWHAFLKAYFKVYHRLTLIHGEILEESQGPFIVIANHSSHLDAALLLAAFPLKRTNHVFALAAKDYFFQSLGKGLLARVLMNSIPFDRTQGFLKGLAMTREVLRVPGHAVILFPEGTRSPDGSLRPFKPGIGPLVARGGGRDAVGSPLAGGAREVRVIAAYIHGAHKALGKGSRLPKPWRLWAIFGKPRSFKNIQNDREGWKEITASLHRQVLDLRQELLASQGL